MPNHQRDKVRNSVGVKAYPLVREGVTKPQLPAPFPDSDIHLARVRGSAFSYAVLNSCWEMTWLCFCCLGIIISGSAVFSDPFLLREILLPRYRRLFVVPDFVPDLWPDFVPDIVLGQFSKKMYTKTYESNLVTRLLVFQQFRWVPPAPPSPPW